MSATSCESGIERIEASSSAQRRLVADAAHELRTPLTGLEGTLEVLRRGAQDGPVTTARLVAVMHREVRRLERLAEQLLDKAGMEQHPPLYLTKLVLEEFLPPSSTGSRSPEAGGSRWRAGRQ